MAINFTKAHKINYTATAVATTSAEINTSAVDTAGYDSCSFLTSVSAARILKVQGGTTSTNATNDITGASVTATAGSQVAIEVHRAQYRYLRLTTVTGVTAIQGDTYSILGIARDKPVSNTGAAFITTTTD
jgi:hypothetical protein